MGLGQTDKNEIAPLDIYRLSKKESPLLYSRLLYKMGHYFFDTKYYLDTQYSILDPVRF